MRTSYSDRLVCDAHDRGLDLSLYWLDTPVNGTWEIARDGVVQGSSDNPNGWSVQVDYSDYAGA